MKSIGTSEISACPFCGFDDVQIDETAPMMFSIICPDCDCIGPQAGIITEAIERWNERTVTQNVQGQGEDTSAACGRTPAPQG